MKSLTKKLTADDIGALQELFSKMEVNFTKQSSCLRKPISAEECMCKLG